MSLPGGYIGPICLGNKLQQIDSVHLLISSGSPPIAEGVAIPHHLLLPIKVAVPCVHVGVCREKHFKKATQVNDTYGLITDNLNALQLHYSLVCACVCVYVCVCVCVYVCVCVCVHNLQLFHKFFADNSSHISKSRMFHPTCM